MGSGRAAMFCETAQRGFTQDTRHVSVVNPPLNAPMLVQAGVAGAVELQNLRTGRAIAHHHARPARLYID